ncbi:MAG: hypothetical protein KGQ49_04180 [Verrucomicrobia bacterium]|nr:hypothetical protein [Verrucomicrobiota bacterium]MBU6446575.1 hypothetical protein [Verrucomicrobiota bacterium]MDE3048221.1 hypothetical protein [Verrucomicrobiota bacterium]
MLRLTVIALLLSWIAYVRTDGFAPWVVEGPLHPTQESIPPEVHSILSHPFEYLAKGRQCFVFVSQDGKYVLKFFNQRYLRLPWYAWLKGPQEQSKRERRRAFYESSYEIAHRLFGEEIVMLHMGHTDALPHVCLRNRAKGSFTLDLNRIPFVLQRKGEPFYEGLQAAFQQKGMEGLYREIDAFVEQIANRIAHHIADADVDVEKNWGYVDGHLFHLDPGRLYVDDQLAHLEGQQKEWVKATHRLHKWLSHHYPDAAEYLSRAINF